MHCCVTKGLLYCQGTAWIVVLHAACLTRGSVPAQ